MTYMNVIGIKQEADKILDDAINSIKQVFRMAIEQAKKDKKTIITKIKIEYGTIDYWNKKNNEF